MAATDQEHENVTRILRSFAGRVDPSDAGAHNNLGVLYFRKGLVDESIESFARALALDERMGVARRNLEIAYSRTGPGSRKAESLEDRLRLNPDDVEARVQSGIAAKSSGRLEEAQSHFAHAIAIDPNSSVLQFFLAEALYNRGMNDDALRAVKRSLALNDGNPDAHYLMGFILGDLGLAEEARGATKRAISLNPALNRAQANLSIETSRDQREVRATPSAGVGRTSGTHLSLGTALLQKSYYDDALREFERALAAGEDEREARRAIAAVHVERAETDRALTSLEQSSAARETDGGVSQDIGLVLQLGGRPEEARKAYEEAVAIDASLAPSHNNLGVLLWHGGERTESVNGFRRALRADPRLKAARLNLALALYHEGHLQLALDAYRNILSGEREDAVSWNGVGLVLTQLEKYPEARNAFARAIESRSDYAEAHYNLGFALSGLGDFDGALAQTERALQLDPFYSPQTLELAVTLPVDADLVARTTPAVGKRESGGGITEFEYDPSVVESLFAETRPSPADSSSAGDADYGLATDYLSKGLYGRAVAEVSRARARGGDARRAWMILGEAFLAQGLFGEAFERFEAALAADPDSVPAATGAAKALLGADRATDAAPYLEQILATDATPEALALAARVRSALGEYDEARNLIARATNSGGPSAEFALVQGTIEERGGDDSAAEASYRRAIELDGASPRLRVALAGLLARMGVLDAAETELMTALEFEPDHEAARYQLVRVFSAGGRYRDAMRMAIVLLRKNVYHLPALIALGEALIDLGRRTDAAVAFRRVLRFDPANADAMEHTARLQMGAA